MIGRYGMDRLSVAAMAAGLIISLLTKRTRSAILYYIPIALYIWALFRCYSKNVVKRRTELEKYYKLTAKVRRAAAGAKTKIKGFITRCKDKDHLYYRCSNCGTMMRVPRYKGSIKVTCPNCRTQSIRKN